MAFLLYIVYVYELLIGLSVVQLSETDAVIRRNFQTASARVSAVKAQYQSVGSAGTYLWRSYCSSGIGYRRGVLMVSAGGVELFGGRTEAAGDGTWEVTRE